MSLIDSAQEFLHTCYGGAVSVKDAPRAQLMHQLSRMHHGLEVWRIAVGEPEWVSWTLFVHRPSPQPSHQRILLSPDGCWPHVVSNEAMHSCAQEGITLAWFNRLDIAHDPPDAQRRGAFYTQFPGSTSGCLAVWAWGIAVSACILRSQYPQAKIGAMGHSRGGKAALLAAASDAQLDAVMSHNSGTGGAASLALAGEGAESLAQLAQQFPHWLACSAQQTAAQDRLQQIDCTALWARIAPRPLLIMQAHDDLWANPLGTRHMHQVLQPTWHQLNAAPSLRLRERSGGHAMQASDWLAAAQFMREFC